MRAIKFRAWDEYNQTMIYPDEHFFKLKSHEILGRYETVMQFTGLKDKNGKEIYEGDIIKSWDNAPLGRHEWIHIVEWSNENLGFRFKKLQGIVLGSTMLHVRETNVEVIGNIYENSELL